MGAPKYPSPQRIREPAISMSLPFPLLLLRGLQWGWICHIAEQVRKGKRKAICPREVFANTFRDFQLALYFSLVAYGSSVYKVDLSWFQTIGALRYLGEKIHLSGGRHLLEEPPWLNTRGNKAPWVCIPQKGQAYRLQIQDYQSETTYCHSYGIKRQVWKYCRDCKKWHRRFRK